MSHLSHLNSEQTKAVLTTRGPVLIIAGAGAGKTKTITHRILHIIKEEGASPREILAITFTNKAAKEMRERVDALLSNDPDLNRPISEQERPFLSTFHSLGVHIIRENSLLLGLTRHFSIFDKSDGKRAIREALAELSLDPKQYEPNKMLSRISKEKGNLVTLDNFREKTGSDYMSRIVLSVWEKYEAILKREKALDFDDLLLKTALLLKTNEVVRTRYQNQWKYIHIDEYQDTNKVQYLIAHMLAEKHKNICVVGDIDQNIYSWRGADIKNILNFEKDYPNATIILLEENYRSTQTILTVANHIISKNKIRREKNLFTKNGEGEKVTLYECFDELDEGRKVAQSAQDLIEKGTEPQHIAILYRANFQSRALEDAFLQSGVPYQVLGVRFFERAEIKDVLSYLGSALDPEVLTYVKRVINIPARGIGKTTIAKLFSGEKESLPPATRAKVESFYELLRKIREVSETAKVSETLKYIIKEAGLETMHKDGTEEGQERIENMRELVTLATKYDGLPSLDAVQKLLEDASLASDQDDMKENMNAVRLMTVHASKGLEFDVVFIVGLEQDLFPHKRFDERSVSEESAEEERRLFYVALTRAKKKLFLSYTSYRTIYGSKQVNVPSEFIFDIDEEHIEREEGVAGERKILYLE